MCRDELLLKLAVIGLLRLDSPVQDTTALLQCYTGALCVRARVWLASTGIMMEAAAVLELTPCGVRRRRAACDSLRADQPNVDRRRVDAVLSAYREARPPTAVR
jgi:hypothetical protein